MKSILSLLSLLMIAGTVQAAEIATLEKGNTQLGGSFSWTQTDSNRDGSYSSLLLIAPSAECFVMDNLSLGGSLFYASSKVSASTSNDTLGVGPSGTFYFGAHENLAYYFHQAVVYTQQMNTSTQGSTVGDSNLGIRFFANSKVAFGIGIDYMYNLGTEASSPGFDHSVGLGGSFVFFL